MVHTSHTASTSSIESYSSSSSGASPASAVTPALQRNTFSGATSVAQASGDPNASAISQLEAAILRATVPIEINETEEITVNGERGIYANKAEIVAWRGVIPITEYKLNEDANPELITKRTEQAVTYQQEVAVRYLRPPTPPPPGEIVIKQECVSLTPPAPPLVLRQMPPRPCTPEPLVIREAPPKAPCTVGRKVITISGRRLPPAPRKVVIERLPPMPNKPQAVLVERWLPYNAVKRRVIFQKDCDKEPTVVKPRNVIVQWEAPRVEIKQEFKYLGVIKANPAEYVAQYRDTLKQARELPEFVRSIKNQDGIQLAAEKPEPTSCSFELEGDVQLMKYVNLDRENLSEYREILAKMGINYVGDAEVNAWIQRASQEMLARSRGQLGAGGSASATVEITPSAVHVDNSAGRQGSRPRRY